MNAIQGKSVQPGIAVGPIRIHRRQEIPHTQLSLLTPQEELARLRLAITQAKEQLEQLQETSSFRLGKELSAIFLVQTTLLEDPELKESVCERILQGMTAEYAVAATGEDCAAMLEATGDSYMCARAADARDVARRVCGILSGQAGSSLSPTPGILMADDLCPSETIGLNSASLLGLISCNGSSNSHSAILARAMGIPSLTGIKIDPDWDGKLAVLDGDTGILYIDPDDQTLQHANHVQQQREAHRRTLLAKAKEPCMTRDGHSIRLCANIITPKEAAQAREMGCQGIGLFRSEFLFLGRDTCPTEEEQFIAYQQTVLAMNGRPVIIRTLDVGADKQAPCLNQPQERNPALGCRGIRHSLTHLNLFRQQLRAILRAAAYGPVSIMFPMVTSTVEVCLAKSLLDQCRQELKLQNIPYGELEIGTMIETPAAVIQAEELAHEVDFFSLGTNDLTQYTLAADRMNPNLDAVYNPRHPALLRQIRHTVEIGHKHGCWVGLCGELAADPSMTQWLLEVGLDELSVSPGALLTIRDRICSTTLPQPVR